MSHGQDYKYKKLEYDPELLNSYSTSSKSVFLPIENYSKEILYTIDNSDVTILIGETGCGKSTKIPEILFKSKNEYKVAHILPRKIATVTIAQRVAKNLQTTLGKEVGYSVRFDYNYTNDTKIKFLTEGMFIRELLIDPLASNYNAIIIDDCHERTINAELILGLVKKISQKRKDLKIIISSATLDYSSYLDFFPLTEGFKSNIFVITGRTYPVDIFYVEKPIKNYIESAVITAKNIHKHNDRNSGDILVFLTGQEDINLFMEYSATYHLEGKDVIILPLYSGLPMEKQLEVFQPTPHNKRKIVVATNIAEASVTIENISFIIDSCLVKMKFYDSKIDTDALYIIPASKFSLNQRAGRAGRTRPGQCYRLVTESFYNNLHQMTNPELLRTNMLEFVLRLKSFGVKNINKFGLITQPDKDSLSRALENLYFLNVIDDNSDLTELGKKVCDMPLDIRLSVTLLKSAEVKFNCVEEVLVIVAMLSIQNLFTQPKNPESLFKAKQKYGVIQGDHLTLLSIYKNYRNCKTGKTNFCREIYLNEHLMKGVEEIISNVKPYLRKYNINVKSSLDSDGEDILKSFLKGFFLNVAQKQSDGSYRSIRSNTSLHIHPTSVLYQIMPEFILFNEVTSTAKNYVKEVSAIEKQWIIESAPNLYEDKTTKVIQDRHKNEIISLSKITHEKDKSVFTGVRQSETSISSVTNFKKSNKIFMEVDKNKDYSYYFEGSDGSDHEQEKKTENKNNTSNLINNTNNISDANIQDDIDEITMLRRMRKRK